MKKKVIAKESSKIKKAKEKLEKKFSAIENFITKEKLDKKIKEINVRIYKSFFGRKVILNKAISLFDENKNSRKEGKKVLEVASAIILKWENIKLFQKENFYKKTKILKD